MSVAIKKCGNCAFYAKDNETHGGCCVGYPSLRVAAIDYCDKWEEEEGVDALKGGEE